MFLSQVQNFCQVVDFHVALIRKTGLLYWGSEADGDGEVALHQVLLMGIGERANARPLYWFVIFDAAINRVATVCVGGATPQFVWIPDDDNGR